MEISIDSSNVFDESAISIVNNLISKAIDKRASDIHFEPLINNMRIRFRIDGLLYNETEISQLKKLQVLSRIKVLANMDISEQRIPQDGKFCLQLKNKNVDFRISTFPSLYGEKIVIRILDKLNNLFDLSALGFDNRTLDEIISMSKKSCGFLLVTGPTGSGKTTTLYCLISNITNAEKNIVTLEEPIEYNLENITQGQVYPEIGFTFAKGIRSLLRQDPDIIMVGEIRDQETAQVALQAALTGHLVLSTLHTNDAPGAIMRLLDMSIEPFLLNAGVTGILAQRLARKLCQHCKQSSELSSQDKIFITKYNLPIEQTYISTGCISCNNTGHNGRIGIFELLILSHKMRALITQKPLFDDIYNQALADDMIPLVIDASNKVNNGIISFAELIRILL